MKVHGVNTFGKMAERNEPTPVTVSIERDELDWLQRGFNALEAVKQIAQRAYDQGDVFAAEDRGVISVCAKIPSEVRAALAVPEEGREP